MIRLRRFNVVKADASTQTENVQDLEFFDMVKSDESEDLRLFDTKESECLMHDDEVLNRSIDENNLR